MTINETGAVVWVSVTLAHCRIGKMYLARRTAIVVVGVQCIGLSIAIQIAHSFVKVADSVTICIIIEVIRNTVFIDVLGAFVIRKNVISIVVPVDAIVFAIPVCILIEFIDVLY